MKQTAIVSLTAIATMAALSLATPARAGQEERYFLINDVSKIKGTVHTDVGPQQTVASGEIAFEVVPTAKGLEIELLRLNLLVQGVQTAKGNSGTIGLALDQPGYRASYDPKSGRFATQEFGTRLHYRLIDDVFGFRRVQTKDGLHFPAYVESASGRIKGTLPPNLQPDDSGPVGVNAAIELALEDTVLGSIGRLELVFSAAFLWERLPLQPNEVLRIQPVFIGSGPDDPTATGVAFDTLVRRAADMWNRCGTERCIQIIVDPPMYVDDDDYRVIADEDEAWDLSQEVEVDGSVEVFVVERFTEAFAVDTGAGGTFLSGTEATRIVTCDQQLDVPCPAPCGYGSCGDVNYFHLAHELGHVLNLDHPGYSDDLIPGTVGSVMEGSGFCLDNPDAQSARNCRNASNPNLTSGRGMCTVSPDIMD